MMSIRTPVLLLVFNRPDFTRMAIDALSRVRPPRLYIAADGPRPAREADVELCRAVRECLESIPWPCEVFRLYSDTNLGSKRRVSSAITWFFEHEAEGIILEDDCHPGDTFFQFCGELLNRYREDERVMLISGDRGLQRDAPIDRSYYFSKYSLTWGWATWRRAWRHYDVHLATWEEFKSSGRLRRKCFDDRECAYWITKVERALSGDLDAWDYQWMITCWMQGGLAVIPRCNLVKNVGFRDDATHTKDKLLGDYSYDASPLAFPLNHPDTVGPERRLELKLWADKFRPAPLWKRIRRKLIRAGVVFYGKVESSFPASSRVNATYPVPGASTTRP